MKYQIVIKEVSYYDGDFEEYHLCKVTKDESGKKEYSSTGLKADSFQELKTLSDGLMKALNKPCIRK